MSGLPRVSDQAGKVALGIVALVEVPQVWSQWQPSISTLRGGDWAGMEESIELGSRIAWVYSLAIAGLISWIIGEWWPLYGAALMNIGSHTIYRHYVRNPHPDNPRADVLDDEG